MTDALERELRRALADHAPDVVDHSDPWDRVQRGVVVRRRRRAGAVAGSLALAVALGGGLAVVQPWAGATADQGATTATTANDPRQDATWTLDDGQPRGSLSSDEDLRAAVEARLVAEMAADQDGDPSVVPGTLRLLFADDVGDTRLVVGVARTDQPGVGQNDVSIELVGVAGTLAEDLATREAPGVAVDGFTWPVVGLVTTGAEPSLLAVVPRSSRVSVSQAAVIGADGVVSREWEPVEVSDDGVVDVALDHPLGHGLAVLRIDSAPGFTASGAVVELALPWPGGDGNALAAQVVERGPRQFSDPLTTIDSPQVVDDVRGNGPIGVPAVDDVELLYASAAGADVERGAQGWSSLVATRVGEGSLVTWQLHDDEGTVVTSAGRTLTEGAPDDRILLRAPVDDGREVVGVWDPLGTLGRMTIDGQDAFLPLAVGFRWFPVTAGAEVVVDGEPVPPVQQQTSSMMWPLPGEEHPGPDPLYRH